MRADPHRSPAPMQRTLPIPISVARALRAYQAGDRAAAAAELRGGGGEAHGHPAGQLLLGAIALDGGRASDAVRAFRRAALLNPGLGQPYSNVAVVMRRSNVLEVAHAAAVRAVVTQPANAGFRNALAAVLLDLDRPARALAEAEAGLANASDDADARLNRGLALWRLGSLATARAEIDAVLLRHPDHLAARYASAHLRLLCGDMPAGWRERDARFSLPGQPGWRPLKGVPVWRGEPLEGRPIAVVADEGRGDMIQYARYLAHSPFDAARVALMVPEYMVRLLAPAFEAVEVTATRPATPVELQTPLSRLPGLLGTSLSTIPARIPYLRAEPERVEQWRRRIGDHGFRVAVCWQGNPDTPVDRGRSIPLRAFAPLAAVPGVRLIALQARHGVEQLSDLPPGMTVETLGDGYDSGPHSFVDPAAVACAVDLVVSSDTALAHLAGALGRPTWVALRRIPDFRWMLDRDDSPWYPTMRLFRQRKEGGWDEVMRRIAEAVGQLGASEPRRLTPAPGAS